MSEAQECGQANVTPASGEEASSRRAEKCYHTLVVLIARLRNNTGALELLLRWRVVQSDLLPLVRYAEELKLKKPEDDGVKTKVCERRSNRVGKMCALPLLSTLGG